MIFMDNFDKNNGINKNGINWYPGHMAKTKRLIREKIDQIDVVYEVIDARIPYSSKIKNIEEDTKNKPRILIMTKIDLCDMNETKKWITYYENLGYTVLGVDLEHGKNINQILQSTREMMQPYQEKRKEKGEGISSQLGRGGFRPSRRERARAGALSAQLAQLRGATAGDDAVARARTPERGRGGRC